MTKISRYAVASAGSAGVVLLAAPAASANIEEDVIAGLENHPVYQTKDAPLSNAEELANAFDGQGVAIISVSDRDLESVSVNYILAPLQESDLPYDTYILVNDGERFVVQGPNEVAISEALYESLGETGDAGEAILQNSELVLGPVTTTEVPSSPTDDGGISNVALGFGVGSFVLVAALAAAILMKVMRKNKAGNNVTSERPSELEHSFLKGLPQETAEKLRKLNELAHVYQNRGDYSMASSIREVITHTRELYTRVKKKAGKSQYDTVTIKYNDILGKLTMALGDDYYLDIVNHPRLWADASKRMKEVERALAETDNQIILNIQQVNANQNLEVAVALDSLTRAMEAPKLKSLYPGNND